MARRLKMAKAQAIRGLHERSWSNGALPQSQIAAKR